MIDRTKIRMIQAHFAPVIGRKLIRYETAELLLDDGTWTDWPDLPIRLYTDAGELISVSWSKLDDLWMANDTSLPFSTEGSKVRWVGNGIEKINAALNFSIKSVLLGHDDVSIGRTEFKIWTRLLIQVDEHWLEIYNALDENGYEFHSERPAGRFISCDC